MESFKLHISASEKRRRNLQRTVDVCVCVRYLADRFCVLSVSSVAQHRNYIASNMAVLVAGVTATKLELDESGVLP